MRSERLPASNYLKQNCFDLFYTKLRKNKFILDDECKSSRNRYPLVYYVRPTERTK